MNKTYLRGDLYYADLGRGMLCFFVSYKLNIFMDQRK